MDIIDAELLKPWERKRQEYKQRKKVGTSVPQPRSGKQQGHVTLYVRLFGLIRKVFVRVSRRQAAVEFRHGAWAAMKC